MISLKSIASFLYVNDKKVLTEGYDNGWDGVSLTEQEVIDFYGVGSLTLQGTFVSAKSYPDGSIVGSNSNGNFTMSANGTLEVDKDVFYTYGIQNTDLHQGSFNYPIVFNGAVTITTADIRGDNGQTYSARLYIYAALSPSSFSFNFWKEQADGSFSYSYVAKGRWK